MNTKSTPQSPRDKFNSLAIAEGLQVVRTTDDGWHQSFVRKDGLHLWRIVGQGGVGIQTAYVKDGAYTDHRPYYRESLLDALSAAVQRNDGKRND